MSCAYYKRKNGEEKEKKRMKSLLNVPELNTEGKKDRKKERKKERRKVYSMSLNCGHMRTIPKFTMYESSNKEMLSQ